MDKHLQRTTGLNKSAVDDLDGERAGQACEGHQWNGHFPIDVKRKLVQTLPGAQNTGRRLSDTLSPCIRRRHTKRPLPALARQQIFCPRAEPLDLGVAGTNTGNGISEYDGDLSGCVWEAIWKLATADVPTEVLGTDLAGPLCHGHQTEWESPLLRHQTRHQKTRLQSHSQTLHQQSAEHDQPTPISGGDETRPRAAST